MALLKEEKEAIKKDFGQHANDTGSAEFQVAMLTKNIKELTEHCRQNHKDFSTKRGLLKMVSQRKKFLGYLKRTDEAKYKELTKRLGLKQQ